MMSSAPWSCDRFTGEVGCERVNPDVYRQPIIDPMEPGNGWPSTILKKIGCGDTFESENVGKKCSRSSNACEHDTLLETVFTWCWTTSLLTTSPKFESGHDKTTCPSFLLQPMRRGLIGSKRSSPNPKNSYSPTPITNRTLRCNVNGTLS